MPETHLTQMILKRCKQYGDRPALYYKKRDSWNAISWKEMGQQITALAQALLLRGLEVQDRVAIYAPNRPEWTISDYAIMGARGITTTIYATNSASEAEYIVNDAQATILFVGGQEQYDRAIEFFQSNAFLKTMVVFDESVILNEADDILYFRDFIQSVSDEALDAELKKRLQEAQADDVATIIYTSGTSGVPKGVMLSHRNLMSQFKALDPLFDISEQDIELCFLPLSHAYQKSSTHWTQSHGVTVYYCEHPAEIMDYFREVRPTFMVGVPRLYEKMYATVLARLEKASSFKQKLFNWAIATGKQFQFTRAKNQPLSSALTFKHKLARKLVLNKIREIMGGRLNFFSAGGAPLAQEIEEFFFAAGIFIAQGYGLTETSPVVSCNRPGQFKFGTPGKVVDICEVKIAEDGEILIKGENVMQGYFNKPDYTAEVFTEDGFFKTGDIGHLDEKGFLHITDRKKDIIITAGGKNIAPQAIESLIGKDYFVEQIAVIGDKRKYITALVVPSFEALKVYAQDKGLTYHSIRDLLTMQPVIDFYEQRLQQLSQSLARYEQIKKFTLLTNPFSQEKGEITPTLKLRRKVLMDNYNDIIEQMYLPV